MLLPLQRAARLSSAVLRGFKAKCAAPTPRRASSPLLRSLRLSHGPFRRNLTTTAPDKADGGAPPSLLQEHAVPEAEGEAVNRIDSLLRLTNRLSRQSTDASIPRNLRGQGVYDRNAPTMPVAAEGEELVPLPEVRRMGDSYVQLDLPFSTEASLREQYVGGISKVRIGRLMEDFDSLAGAAAYKHVLPDGVDLADASKYGFYLVTAAVDRMDLLRPLQNADGSVPDLRLSGHVSYTTSSSLEVFLRMATLPSSPDEDTATILVGRFAMACRSVSGGKHSVPQLLVDGPEEQAMWQMGRDMRQGKKKRSSASLNKTPPTAEEAAMLHDLFLQRAEIYDRKTPTPSDIVFMSDTRISSANLMHPAERNVHAKIFGGHLMRLAYETAYSTACLFSRAPVVFVSLDELQFVQPVEIGSLLLLDSQVTFSPMQGEHHSFHVSVEAATCDLFSGEKKITNTFHYTFSSERPLYRHVIPRTYRQAMHWLDAQRRRRVGIEVRQAYTQAL